MSNECLTCGSKKVDPNRVMYMVIPGMIIPGGGTMYLLCDEHKNVRYNFDDVYEEDGTRKNIDHESVIKRGITL